MTRYFVRSSAARLELRPSYELPTIRPEFVHPRRFYEEAADLAPDDRRIQLTPGKISARIVDSPFL